MKFLKVSFFYFAFLVLPARASFIDESSSVFFPPALKSVADITHDFSFFWKALLLVENSPEARTYLPKLCNFLKEEKEIISEYYCTPNKFKINDQLLKEWIQDTPLREKIPSADEFQKKATSQLAAASLPGVPREFLSVVRQDPLGESFKLWSLRQGIFSFPSQVDGYFSNQDNTVLVIPLSFVHAPQEIEKTQGFFNRLESLCDNGCPRITVMGPHGASMVNQTQIIKDLKFVSILGAFLFGLTMLLMGWKRGVALLALCVPLTISIVIAILTTVAVMGSIHGLTLAFGPSLVGLVLDYGIHTKIHKGSQKAWASNLFGLLTTLSGFIALAFSDIPLLRQMMLFAVVGLLSAFVLYYFFSQSKLRIWTQTEFKVFAFDMKPNKWSGSFALLLILAAFVSFPFMEIELSLKNFEYQQNFQSQLESKMWGNAKTPEIFFKIHSQDDVASLEYEKHISSENQISHQSLSTFLPSTKSQIANLSTWKNNRCRNIELEGGLSKQFYEPFFALKPCETKLRTFTSPPLYTADYVSRRSPMLLSVWAPKNADEIATLRKEIPETTSIRQVFQSFPHILLEEIALMLPVGLLICLLLIFYHTKSFKLSLLAIVPMFCSVGLVFVAFILMGKALSFVSCVALLMIFGSSVDYGIFKVDSLREEATQDAEEKIFSSLLMNALLTFVGYLPLVFAKHPVLNDLGWVLSLGTIGAFLGGVWGVSFIAQKIKTEVMCEKTI